MQLKQFLWPINFRNLFQSFSVFFSTFTLTKRGLGTTCIMNYCECPKNMHIGDTRAMFYYFRLLKFLDSSNHLSWFMLDPRNSNSWFFYRQPNLPLWWLLLWWRCFFRSRNMDVCICKQYSRRRLDFFGNARL